MGSFDSVDEGMIVKFDGSIIAHGTTGRVDEIIIAEIRSDLSARGADPLGAAKPAGVALLALVSNTALLRIGPRRLSTIICSWAIRT